VNLISAAVWGQHLDTVSWWQFSRCENSGAQRSAGAAVPAARAVRVAAQICPSQHFQQQFLAPPGAN
jgi:hypothetical protein